MHGEEIHHLETLLPQFSSVDSNDRVTILSTFKPTSGQNIFFISEEECSSLGVIDAGTLVCLNLEESLCLLGNFRLIVLRGSLELCGTALNASEIAHRIFAPRCSPLPVVKAGRDGMSLSIFSDQTIPDRLRGILEFNTVVMLQRLETGLERLSLVCRPFYGMFEPSRWQRTNASSDLEVSGLYMVSNLTKELYPFILPSTWSDALDAIMIVERDKFLNPELPGVYIIKGPKNSGKSTFARTLVNRLLDLYSRVAFLECDVGQPEFTPPGMVSLNVISQPVFGPPFTHPTLPYCAHFIGSPTPRSSPSYYIEAISSLLHVYRRDIQTPESHLVGSASASKITDNIPIVVNTMGWIKGLGADMNQKIESVLQPTDIFKIEGISHQKQQDPSFQESSWSYGTSDFDDSTARMHVLEPTPHGSTMTGITALDHRNITMLSYFHALFPRDVVPGPLEQITAHQWDISRPLCDVPPFEVDCSTAFDKIILTGAGSEDVVHEEVSRVLNGAVVGLVACDHGLIDQKPDSSSVGLPYTRGCEPPSPLSSKCVGLAVVRAVSSSNRLHSASTPTYLHLLTPVPYPLLSRPRVLVKGELELPIWALLDFRTFLKDGQETQDVTDVELEKAPFLLWGKVPDGVLGGKKRRIRRNIMRRGQI